MDAGVKLPFRLCVCREPHPQSCTPPGFEWLPDYLAQYGGQLTDYGRDWLLAKWDEPYRAALETAEREYQECLKGGVTEVQPQTGLQLRVASKLAAGPAQAGNATGSGLASRLAVPFTAAGGGPVPCDPFDPEHQPGDPVDVPVSVPLSVFWTGVTAFYDLESLKQAMQPVNANLNPDNPLSRRDLRLDANGVRGAVRIAGHGFLPMPGNVEAYDDLGVDLQVASIRLDLSAEWGEGGAVLDQWSAINASDAYTDFYCYYLGCPWWTPPPPVFDWNLVPPGCIDDVVIRALPTAVTVVRVNAGTGEPLGESVLSISNVGTIASRPVVARHRIFNSPGTPHQVLSLVEAGPAALGETQEVEVALPACVVGKVALAPDTIQDYNLFQQDGYLGVQALPGAGDPEAPETIKLRLTRLRNLYHWDRDVDVRFIPISGVDVGYPSSGWWPHLILRVPVSWSQCDSFRPDTDSQAQVALVSWSATDTYSAPPRWLHRLELRVIDYAAPCDAFDCVWGTMKVTWPNGTQQTQQIFCVEGDIDLPRVFTLKLNDSAPPTVTVELTLHYEGVNRRRNVAGNGFDYLAVPGSPAVRTQTLTP